MNTEFLLYQIARNPPTPSAIAVYEKNTADAQAAFTQERLPTHHLGDGWEP